MLLVLGFSLSCVFKHYYNLFLSMHYDVQEAHAQIETQLQRRKNIIDSLGLMVLNYGKHEKEIFMHATEARSAQQKARSARSRTKGGGAGAVLGQIMAVAERYPDLRLSRNFQRFMDAFVESERQIASERKIYNARANKMSTQVGRFPGLIFARIYGFKAPEFFRPEPEALKPPRLKY